MGQSQSECFMEFTDGIGFTAPVYKMVLVGRAGGRGWQNIQLGGKNGAENWTFCHFFQNFGKFGGKNAIKCWFVQLRGWQKKELSKVYTLSERAENSPNSNFIHRRLQGGARPAWVTYPVVLWLTKPQSLKIFLNILKNSILPNKAEIIYESEIANYNI